LRANWIREGKDGLRALVGVRAGLNLLVETMDVHADGDELWVEAWSGEPEDSERYEDSDGIAVIGTDEVPERVAVIPLCGCGIRGCGKLWGPASETDSRQRVIRPRKASPRPTLVRQETHVQRCSSR
jgi:hypothetical protein